MKYLSFLACLAVVMPVYASECDFIQFNKCQSCESLYAFSVGSDEACSFLCPNRVINYAGSGSQVVQRNCVLKQCPSDFPFEADDGSCFATEEEAYQQPPQEDINTNNDDILDGKTLDEKAIFSETKPLKRWDGKLFSCDEEKVIRIETECNIKENCEDICPNRTILYWVGGNVPSVPNCPKDKPLMDSEGICFACDTPVAIGLEYNTRLCKKFCPNERHLESNNCVLN